MPSSESASPSSEAAKSAAARRASILVRVIRSR
jgi:hypothetical protein